MWGDKGSAPPRGLRPPPKTLRYKTMKYLENLNEGWWKDHEQHKSHFVGWFITFKQLEKQNERLGFRDLAQQMNVAARKAKRELQRVLVGNI